MIGIVAAAGSTATGAFDPLDELADVAARHRPVAPRRCRARRRRRAVADARGTCSRGIERADSVVWDAHKLLMMPALVTAVLFKREATRTRRSRSRRRTCSRTTRPGETWWDLGQRTLECTKRAMAIELWTTLRVHGEAWFGAVIDRQIALATALAAKRQRGAGLRAARSRPTSNIVCYRHRPAGLSTGRHSTLTTARSARECVEDGRFYIVGTQLPARLLPALDDHEPADRGRRDLDELLVHLRALCRS